VARVQARLRPDLGQFAADVVGPILARTARILPDAPAHGGFMRVVSGLRSRDAFSGGTAGFPPPPKSGVRPSAAVRPNVAIRSLAREAEALDLEEAAFELFFVASRLDATDRVDLACRDLDRAALEAPEAEARFYRRATQALHTGLTASRDHPSESPGSA
jgi:hypothetical protein